MPDTPDIDTSSPEYQDALGDLAETLGEQSVRQSQTQLDDLRDRFQEALDDQES